MKNIFIEGLQGMGKSFLTQKISEQFPELCVCREGDYSPVELAWCTWMTKEEYEGILEEYAALEDLKKEIAANTVLEGTHYIVCYTKILTEIPGFHKNLEQYEIYNGRKTLQELEEIILSRYSQFSGTGYVSECAWMQNILEELLLYFQLSDDEILAFYRRLYNAVQREHFLLLYLYSDRIEETIRIIQKERADAAGNQLWYELMMSYFTSSPYGQAHGCTEFEELVMHFAHRQRLELRIIKEIIRENACILPAKQWDMGQITDWLLRNGLRKE